MERKKLIAFGALFAILLMVGSGVLVGFSYLFSGQEQNPSGDVRELSLSAYKNSSVNMDFNGISDVIKYLPSGVVYAQYVHDPNNINDVFNNTTGINSALVAYMYYYSPTEDGSYGISTDSVYFYEPADISKAKVTGRYLGESNGYALLALEDGRYMIPGNPTIVGSQYAVGNILSILGGSAGADTYNVIASHIPEKNSDYEYLAMAGSTAGYEQYFESGGTSDNAYALDLRFLNMSDDLRSKMETTLASSKDGVRYICESSDDGVFSITAYTVDSTAANTASTTIGGILEEYSEEQSASAGQAESGETSASGNSTLAVA